MDNKIQLAEKLKTTTNILLTVSNNPSVDQLAACIGMTLWLNKTGKHATAVFSGNIPDTLEFLQPEDTLEKSTDSLRDFIIALDKSKADKLRYKVEDSVVKIFITPYRTSLSVDDLEFSQGDFNVDAIVALGVTKQDDLDRAIVAHGRILHDAVVATINTVDSGDLGSINWRDVTASSLSELVYDLCEQIDAKQLDAQIATALLTGIVAETKRFSNDKTTQNTMSVAAALMGAGANQQLVANKLDDELTSTKSSAVETPTADASTRKDGMLEIDHTDELPKPVEPLAIDQSAVEPTSEPSEANQTPAEPVAESINNTVMTEPPSLGGTFTANSRPDDMQLQDEAITDPLSLPNPDDGKLLDRKPYIESEPAPDIPDSQPPAGPGLTDSPVVNNKAMQTLSELEQAVDSPHLKAIKDQVNASLNDQAIPKPDETQNNTEFNPADFGLEPEENNDPNAPPPVPPPLWTPPSSGTQPPA
jgi:hypothetical protein